MDKYTIDEIQYKNGYRKGYEDGKRDAVEVVRCEKCEHWEKVYGGQFCRQFGYCNECKMDTPSDHFCSYGERSEGE